MEINEEELNLEQNDAEATTIKLVSTSVKCEVCKSGTVVKVGRETPLVIYTRFGTKKAVHVEMRCNNRALPCRAGHYYGFVRNGTAKVINGDALKGDFLVISNQTAFSIDYLWDMTLQILFSRATFEGLGNIFNNLHFTNLPYDSAAQWMNEDFFQDGEIFLHWKIQTLVIHGRAVIRYIRL